MSKSIGETIACTQVPGVKRWGSMVIRRKRRTSGRFGAFPVFTSIPIEPVFHAITRGPRAGFSQMFAYREHSLSTIWLEVST